MFESSSSFGFLTSTLSSVKSKCRFCPQEFSKFNELIKHESTHYVPVPPPLPPLLLPPVEELPPEIKSPEKEAIVDGDYLLDEDFDDEEFEELFNIYLEKTASQNKKPKPKREDELQILQRVSNYDWEKDAEKVDCTKKSKTEFKCKRCGKCLGSKWTLFHHIMVHDKVKFYKCQYCDLAYSQAVNRERHETEKCKYKYNDTLTIIVEKLLKNAQNSDSVNDDISILDIEIEKELKKVENLDLSGSNQNGQSKRAQRNVQKFKTTKKLISRNKKFKVNSSVKVRGLKTTDTAADVNITFSNDPKEVELLSEDKIQQFNWAQYFVKIANGKNPSNFKCKTCHKILAHYSRRQLYSHKLADDGIRFGCHFCSTTFISFISRDKHESTHSSDPIRLKKWTKKGQNTQIKRRYKRKVEKIDISVENSLMNNQNVIQTNGKSCESVKSDQMLEDCQKPEWRKYGIRVNNRGGKAKYQCLICKKMVRTSWTLKIHNQFKHGGTSCAADSSKLAEIKILDSVEKVSISIPAEVEDNNVVQRQRYPRKSKIQDEKLKIVNSLDDVVRNENAPKMERQNVEKSNEEIDGEKFDITTYDWTKDWTKIINNKFLCLTCGGIFDPNVQMYHHSLEHSGEKPKECSRKFNKPYYKDAHEPKCKKMTLDSDKVPISIPAEVEDKIVSKDPIKSKIQDEKLEIENLLCHMIDDVVRNENGPEPEPFEVKSNPKMTTEKLKDKIVQESICDKKISISIPRLEDNLYLKYKRKLDLQKEKFEIVDLVKDTNEEAESETPSDFEQMDISSPSSKENDDLDLGLDSEMNQDFVFSPETYNRSKDVKIIKISGHVKRAQRNVQKLKTTKKSISRNKKFKANSSIKVRSLKTTETAGAIRLEKVNKFKKGQNRRQIKRYKRNFEKVDNSLMDNQNDIQSNGGNRRNSKKTKTVKSKEIICDKKISICIPRLEDNLYLMHKRKFDLLKEEFENEIPSDFDQMDISTTSPSSSANNDLDLDLGSDSDSEMKYEDFVFRAEFYKWWKDGEEVKIPGKWTKYRCLICKKYYQNKEALFHHQSRHTGQKPYSCKNCLKKFTQPQNRNKHFAICNLSNKRNLGKIFANKFSNPSKIKMETDDEYEGNDDKSMRSNKSRKRSYDQDGDFVSNGIRNVKKKVEKSEGVNTRFKKRKLIPVDDDERNDRVSGIKEIVICLPKLDNKLYLKHQEKLEEFQNYFCEIRKCLNEIIDQIPENKIENESEPEEKPLINNFERYLKPDEVILEVPEQQNEIVPDPHVQEKMKRKLRYTYKRREGTTKWNVVKNQKRKNCLDLFDNSDEYSVHVKRSEAGKGSEIIHQKKILIDKNLIVKIPYLDPMKLPQFKNLVSLNLIEKPESQNQKVVSWGPKNDFDSKRSPSKMDLMSSWEN